VASQVVKTNSFDVNQERLSMVHLEILAAQPNLKEPQNDPHRQAKTGLESQ
jgi:hypothetical protein